MTPMKSASITFALLALTAAGCASSPDRPVQQLTRAESSVRFAEQSGARQYSTTALDTARDKLARADQAAERGDNEIAERLAAEAELDAEFAAAKATRGKADDALSEVRDSIETLRNEITRGAPND